MTESSEIKDDVKLVVARGIRDVVRKLDGLIDRLCRLEKIVLRTTLQTQRRLPISAAPSAIPFSSVTITFQVDGSGIAVFDNSEPIRLPPNLAALLAILIEDSGNSSDALVGWKSIKEIRIQLSQKGRKKKITKRALLQSVYRLRNLLESHGLSRTLVQYHACWGFRFAVRKKKSLLLHSYSAPIQTSVLQTMAPEKGDD